VTAGISVERRALRGGRDRRGGNGSREGNGVSKEIGWDVVRNGRRILDPFLLSHLLVIIIVVRLAALARLSVP